MNKFIVGAISLVCIGVTAYGSSYQQLVTNLSSGKKLPPAMEKSLRQNYCTGIDQKVSLINDIRKLELSNFDKLRVGSQAVYSHSIDGEKKKTGREIWKVTEVKGGVATVSITEIDGTEKAIKLRRDDLIAPIKASAKAPITCLVLANFYKNPESLGKNEKPNRVAYRYTKQEFGEGERVLEIKENIPFSKTVIKEGTQSTNKPKPSTTKVLTSYQW